MKENFDDFIGYEIGVLDKNCKEYKKITIKGYKYLKDVDTIAFVGDDGEVYCENELNWLYKLTPAAVMMLWLQDNREEIIKVLNDFDYMSSGILYSWLDMLKKQGIIVSNEDDKAEKDDADAKPKPDSVGDMLLYQWLKFNSAHVKDVIDYQGALYTDMSNTEKLFNDLMAFLEKKEYIKKGE